MFCLHQGGIHCLTWAWDIGPRVLRVGCQKRYLSRQSTPLLFCHFYLAKSRVESTAWFGLETWALRLDWVGGCQKSYLPRQSASLVFCLFYLAKSRVWNPLPGVRIEPESSRSWVSETIPLEAEHFFDVLPLLFGQVQDGIHCPTWVWDKRQRVVGVGTVPSKS